MQFVSKLKIVKKPLQATGLLLDLFDVTQSSTEISPQAVLWGIVLVPDYITSTSVLPSNQFFK